VVVVAPARSRWIDIQDEKAEDSGNGAGASQ
jgi:hypothetical protein